MSNEGMSALSDVVQARVCEYSATPHPSLPLKGGGSFFLAL
jgi:hypothetical protein